MAKHRIFKVCQNCPARKIRENPEKYIIIEKEKLKEILDQFPLSYCGHGLFIGGNKLKMFLWYMKLRKTLLRASNG